MIAPAGGEVVGDSPDRRVEILCDHDALAATCARLGPRRDGADLHVHRHHSDLFYVLEGELTVRLRPPGEGVAVPAGTLARVPPLVVHGFGNEAETELRYVNLHAPGRGFAGYLRALRDGRTVAYDQELPPADGGRPATEAAIGGAEAVADGVALLADVEEIAISETRAAPGRPSPPAHVHRRHLESLYVLEGELALIAGDRELRATAGSWAQVPPGVAHRLCCPGPEPARVLTLHTPSCGFGAFLRALRETGDEGLAAARTGFDQHPA